MSRSRSRRGGATSTCSRSRGQRQATKPALENCPGKPVHEHTKRSDSLRFGNSKQRSGSRKRCAPWLAWGGALRCFAVVLLDRESPFPKKNSRPTQINTTTSRLQISLCQLCHLQIPPIE
jgi:hypothetical protein